MTYILYRWLLLTAALYLTDLIIPGISIEGVWSAFLAAALLALLNALVRPILIILTLPITIVTMGLFILVINALILWMVGSLGIEGFRVDGFLPALLGSIVLSIVSAVLNKVLAR